jgi:acetyl esterase/lipase
VTRDHVIVLPGGGYSLLSERNRGATAPWLAALGLEASVLDYPTTATHPAPLTDAPLRAVRREIRERRAAGAERIALLGYSAGGHLAGLAALAPGATPEERVDLVVLSYPVVSMELETGSPSLGNLLGPEASEEDRAAFSLDRLVTPDAPPFFVWHAADDPVVPVEQSYRLGVALAAAGVPHALHVFPHGGHGLNVGEGDPLTRRWPALCASWLREEGWLPSAPTAGTPS